MGKQLLPLLPLFRRPCPCYTFVPVWHPVVNPLLGEKNLFIAGPFGCRSCTPLSLTGFASLELIPWTFLFFSLAYFCIFFESWDWRDFGSGSALKYRRDPNHGIAVSRRRLIFGNQRTKKYTQSLGTFAPARHQITLNSWSRSLADCMIDN